MFCVAFNTKRNWWWRHLFSSKKTIFYKTILFAVEEEKKICRQFSKHCKGTIVSPLILFFKTLLGADEMTQFHFFEHLFRVKKLIASICLSVHQVFLFICLPVYQTFSLSDHQSVTSLVHQFFKLSPAWVQCCPCLVLYLTANQAKGNHTSPILEYLFCVIRSIHKSASPSMRSHPQIITTAILLKLFIFNKKSKELPKKSQQYTQFATVECTSSSKVTSKNKITFVINYLKKCRQA